MVENDYLYHYTTVDTLKLILSNKTLKFNSLDRLDDLEEGKSKDAAPLRRFTFVSCWTDSGSESIPMWKMYASLDKGVRIKMKKYPFKRYDNRRRYAGIIEGAADLSDDSSNRYSLIPLEKLLNLPYFFNIIQPNNFLYEVEYTNDVDRLYPEIVNRNPEKIQVSIDMLGKIKDNHWSFQKEWRYVINLLPMNMKSYLITGDFMSVYDNMLNQDYKSPIDIFTLDLSDEALNTMEIMFSPNIEEADREAIKEVIDKNKLDITLHDSDLTGKIRK